VAQWTVSGVALRGRGLAARDRRVDLVNAGLRDFAVVERLAASHCLRRAIGPIRVLRDRLAVAVAGDFVPLDAVPLDGWASVVAPVRLNSRDTSQRSSLLPFVPFVPLNTAIVVRQPGLGRPSVHTWASGDYSANHMFAYPYPY
jgi:hypothetical protein